MKKFLLDRIALRFVAVGIVLMIFTLAWRVNPVESSVVPRFLTDNPLGMAVLCFLLGTCMPAYIAVLILIGSIFGEHSPFLNWIPEWFPAFGLLAVLFQTIIYFLLGKLVSVGVRKFAKRKKATAP